MRRRSRLPHLGELERAILARLWSHGPADVKAMQRAIGEARGIKPNTVQSTLDRLHGSLPAAGLRPLHRLVDRVLARRRTP